MSLVAGLLLACPSHCQVLGSRESLSKTLLLLPRYDLVVLITPERESELMASMLQRMRMPSEGRGRAPPHPAFLHTPRPATQTQHRARCLIR